MKEVRYRCANRPYQARRLISPILKHHLPRGAGGLHAPHGDGTFDPGHFSEHPALVNGSAYRDYGLDYWAYGRALSEANVSLLLPWPESQPTQWPPFDALTP